MSTPLLYNKVTPNIKKPLLGFCFFLIGFIAYSALIILPYYYGIVVPKKEGILAISSFIVLFIIYTLFTYDSYAGFKFPYFIQKYLIDQNLRHDLEDNHSLSLKNAKILDLQLSSKSVYALLIESDATEKPEWYYVNLNLMFPKLYFFSLIKLESSCIGQHIDFEYLPASKVILKMSASDIETDFSNLDGTPFFCAVPKTLQRIPSQFLLDFQHITALSVVRDTNSTGYQLICKTPVKSYAIASSTKGFRHLELALSNKINWNTYHQFKNDQNLIEKNISN